MFSSVPYALKFQLCPLEEERKESVRNNGQRLNWQAL